MSSSHNGSEGGTTASIQGVSMGMSDDFLSRLSPEELQELLGVVSDERDGLQAEIARWRERSIRAEIEAAKARADADAFSSKHVQLAANISQLTSRIAELESQLSEEKRLGARLQRQLNTARETQAPSPAPTSPAPEVVTPSTGQGETETVVATDTPAEPSIERLPAPYIEQVPAAFAGQNPSMLSAIAVLDEEDCALLQPACDLKRPAPARLLATINEADFDCFLVTASDRANEGSWRNYMADVELKSLLGQACDAVRAKGRKSIFMLPSGVSLASAQDVPLEQFDLFIAVDEDAVQALIGRFGEARVLKRPEALLAPCTHSPFVQRKAAHREQVLGLLTGDGDDAVFHGINLHTTLNLFDNRTSWTPPDVDGPATMSRGSLLPRLDSFARATQLCVTTAETSLQASTIASACGAPAFKLGAEGENLPQLQALLDNEEALRRYRAQCWRDAVQTARPLSCFLADIRRALGLVVTVYPGEAEVRVIAKIQARDDLERLAKSLASQTKRCDRLILLSADLPEASVMELAQDMAADMIEFCEWEQSAIEPLVMSLAGENAITVVMKPNALYGRNYLLDVSLAARSVDNCTIGRHTRYVLDKEGRLKLSSPGHSMREVGGVASSSVAFIGNALTRTSLENALTWSWFTASESIVSLHQHGYVELAQSGEINLAIVADALEG